MTSVYEAMRRLIQPKGSLPAGIYHYQSPPDVSEPYRLHLRIDNDGQGILIVNASTVLHLSQTATEYAYHIVNQTPVDKLIEQVSMRYRANKKTITDDFEDFKETLNTLIETPDLDPETYLGFDRNTPYTKDLVAPYRLDCAITYRLPEGVDPTLAPMTRVDRELSTAEWKIIFEKAWQAGIPHLIFTGGEPTLREDLFELLEFAELQGQVTGLNTDGKRLSDPDYFDRLLKTGLDHLTIIFDPDYDQPWSTISQCVSADIFFTVHLTITLENATNAPDIITRLKSIGVEHLSLSTPYPELFSTISDLRNSAAEKELSLVWDIPVPYSAFNPVALELREETQPQGAGKAWCYVEPDGDVLPTQGYETKLGNLLENTWEDVWLNARKFAK